MERDVHEELVWIRRAQRGDDQAFTQLVERYQRPVYNLCYRMLGEANVADDAAQETFVRAYQNLQRFDVQRPFDTWLLSIAAHYCIDLLRRRRFSIFSMDDDQEGDGPLIWVPDHSALHPEQEAIRHEEQDLLRRLINTLEATDRAAIILRCFG